MISLRSALKPHNLTSVRKLADVTKVPDESVRRQALRTLLVGHYQRLGGFRGPLGMAMGDVRITGGGGYIPYAGGRVEMLDTGPQGTQTYEVEITYLGAHCHRESGRDQLLSSSDEPYFIISAAGTAGLAVVRHAESGVDAGEDRPALDKFITNAVPPVALFVHGMEHDQGSKDDAVRKTRKVLEAVQKDAEVVISLLFGVNVGQFVPEEWRKRYIGYVVEGGAALFGLADDEIGKEGRILFNYDVNKQEWTQLPRIGTFHNNDYNVVLTVGGQGEGRYDLYFDAKLFKLERKLAPA